MRRVKIECFDNGQWRRRDVDANGILLSPQHEVFRYWRATFTMCSTWQGLVVWVFGRKLDGGNYYYKGKLYTIREPRE